MYPHSAVSGNPTNQSFTASRTAKCYRDRNRPLEFAIIAPRKIALGSDFSCCSYDAGNMENTKEYRQKQKERGKKLSCSSKKILSAYVLFTCFTRF